MPDSQRERVDTLDILLIEDNPGDARLFEEHLREITEESGLRWEEDLASGISALDGGVFDVVALDVGLPDNEGTSTVEQIREVAPDIPIVVLTGHESENLALSMLEVGATEYIRKSELAPTLLVHTLRWAVERASLKQVLRKRERELRSITDNISQGIYRSAPGEGLIYANQAFVELFGYENPEEILNVEPTTLYVSADRRRELRNVLRAEGRFENEEVEFRRKDGSTFTGLLSGTVVREETGAIVSFDGAVTDISERREAKTKLEASEKRVRSVLDAVAANVAVIDRRGEIIDVNERWTRFAEENDGDPDRLGVGANYLSACAPAERTAHSAIPAVRAEIRAVAEGRRELFEYEYPCHGPEEERWFLLRATPLRREEGGAVVAHINVTDRVKAVRDQRVLSEAIEQSSEAVLITGAETLEDPGPEIRYVNSALERMTGYSEEDLLGKSPRVLQGPKTDREVLDSLRAALEAEESWEGETVNYRKDGTPYVVQWSVAPVRDADGEVEYWVSVQRDVTEQREREEALRQNRNLLNQTQRLAGAWEADLRTGELSWSEEVYRIHEVPSGTRIKTDEGIAFYAPEARDEIRAAFERCVEEGEPYDVELPIDTAEGNRRWIRSVGAPSETEDGEVLKVAGAVQDITDRKEAERELAESEERYRTLAEHFPNGAVGVYDRDLRYTLAAGELLGEHLPSSERLEGDRMPDIFPDSTASDLEPMFRAAVEEGVWGEAETTFGGRIWRVWATPLRNSDGEVFAGLSYAQDVTEHRRREEALRQREAQLRGLANSIPGVVFQAYARPGREYGFHVVSRHAETILGISGDADDFFERCIARVPGSHREDLLETIDEAVDAEGRLKFESPFVKPSGETIWLLGTATPEPRENELVYNGVILDITERKNAERALEEREEYLSVTLQSIGDAVVATDRDGCVTEMNSVAERLTGWSQEEAEEKPLDEILTLHNAQTGELVDNPAEKVLHEGTTVGLANHTILTSRDGTEYQIANSAAPIQAEEGTLRGIVLVFRDVTQEYERRRQMERQNDLFAKAQDLAKVGGWEYNVETDEAIWTDEVYRIHGLPLDAEPSPEQSLQFYHPDDRPRIEDAFERAIEEEKPYDLELRLITEEGEERWVRTRGEPQIVDGDVVRVRGTIQDVTDQKKYEGELERMTDLLRLAEEMTDVGGWSVDVRGERPYQAAWTDHLYDIFGLSSRDEPPTEDVFEYYHPEDRERHRKAVHRAADAGEGWDQELRLLRADGTERWVHNIGVPITEAGDVVEIRGAVQDITQRKERERELRETKRLLERTFESLNEAVVVVGPANREIIACNSAVENIFGYEPNELIGRGTEVLHVDRDAHERFGRLGEPHLEEHGSFSTEYRMRRKDGTVIETENVVSPLKGDEWQEGVVSVVRDITERKTRERELRAAKEEAERMNRLKSAFLANMSHEIRTPLTSILGFAEIIDEEVMGLEPRNVGVDLSRLSRYSGLIRKSGRRLMETLEGVLDLSKLEAGEMNLADESVDLTSEIPQLVDEFEPQAKDAGVDLHIECVEEGVWANADAGGVRMAIGNLVSNAIKYTPSEGSVCVRVWEDEGEACVEVEDTGIGMDPDLVPELFEAFAQESEGMDREFEGSGLGLAVTKKVLDQMGASIEVETEKGEGSCFTVRFPQAQG